MSDILDSRQLRAFVTVAQTGSFTVASRKLYLTQSAISHQIKALEEQLDAPLFDRSGKQARLTAAGSTLLPRAQEILARLEEARAAVDEGKGGGGPFRLGAAATVCEYLLPPLLREFRKRFPKVRLSVEPADTPLVVEHLLAGQLDFGIVLLPVRQAALETLDLFEDELVAIVPPKHSWAKKKVVPLEEIPHQPFIVYSRKSVTYQLLEKFLRAHGLAFPSCVETGEADVIKAMVKMDLGVGLVAPWIVKRELRQKLLAAVPFAGGQLRRLWGIARRRGRHWPAAHRAFVGLCRNLISPPGVRL